MLRILKVTSGITQHRSSFDNKLQLQHFLMLTHICHHPISTHPTAFPCVHHFSYSLGKQLAHNSYATAAQTRQTASPFVLDVGECTANLLECNNPLRVCISCSVRNGNFVRIHQNKCHCVSRSFNGQLCPRFIQNNR